MKGMSGELQRQSTPSSSLGKWSKNLLHSCTWQTRLCRTAVDFVSALLESNRKFSKGCVEHRSHDRGERAAAKFVVDEEFNLAGVLPERHKTPAVLHALERSAKILDKNPQIRPIQRDATGEGFANNFVGHRHVSDQDSGTAFLGSALQSQRAAEGHKFRIFFDIRDQIEHIGGGVRDATPRREMRH